MLEAVGRTDTPTTVAASSAKRKELFLQYMDFLCRDDSGQTFQLNAETDFIARGKGKSLKGDVQGCSDFNPVFLLSKQEEDGCAKDKERQELRNRLYAPDPGAFARQTAQSYSRGPFAPSPQLSRCQPSAGTSASSAFARACRKPAQTA